MRCAYCGVIVTEYPKNGICACCGGVLPEPRIQTQESVAAQPVQQIFINVPPQTAGFVGAYQCPKCRSTHIVPCKRGFSWGLGILGFLLFPGLGILLGFCGRNKPRYQCVTCRRKWKYN